MKIIHNGLFLTRPGTGTGEYTANLLAALPEAMPDDTHVVLVPEEVQFTSPNLTIEVIEQPYSWLGRGISFDQWETRGVVKALGKLAGDIYHAHYPTPVVDTSLPVVMTVHDAIPWRWTQYRATARRRLKLRRQMQGIAAAKHILTVSETSKNEILAVTDRHPADITVTYNGVEEALFRPVTAHQVKAFTERHGLTRPYVLYFGGYDYRKNVRRLVEAFAGSGLPATHDLVLAGALSAPRTKLYSDYADLPHLVHAHGIANNVQRIGFVSQEEKSALLKAADAFVYPSLDEGFGLPIVEALAVGTPVIASSIPSTKELFGEAVATFPPDNTNEFARVLRQQVGLVGSPRKAAGRRIAKEFTWSAVAEKTARAYRSVM